MFSFAAPLFLWGLLSLSLPVLAHLINRETKRRLDFPSLRFLRQSKLPQTGRRSPRDLLLLLLRLALLALIVLAIAQPRWTPAADPEGVTPTGDREQVALVLDASASMAGWGNWERAMNRVDEILRKHKGADFAMVVSANGPMQEVPLASDPAAITQVARSTQPTLFAGRHRGSVQAARALLSGGGKRTLFLISDFQQTDWQEVAPPGWDSATTVELADVGPAADERENVAVTSARAVPLGEEGKRVLVELRNFGAQPASATLITEVGQTRQEGTMEVEAGGTRSLVFDMKAEPGSQRGRVSLNHSDPYQLDNELIFWAGEPPALPLLAVTATGQGRGDSALIFLQAALGVRAQPSWLTFQVAPVEANLFYPRDLEGARGLLLLGSAGQIPRDALPALRKFAEDGGVILATPGQDSALNFRALQEADLLDATVRSEVEMAPGDRRPFRIAPIKSGNPLLELFPPESLRDLYLWQIYRYVRIELQEEIAPLLSMPDGSPLLLRKPIGKGALLLSTFDFDAGSSDLPLRGSFLPLVRELLLNSLPAEPGIARLAVGADPVAGDARGLETISLDQRRLVNTSEPGVQSIANLPIEVNVSRQESIPYAGDLLELASQFQPAGSEPAAASAALATADAGAPQPVELAPWAALLAVLLFLVEMPLSVWLSGRTLAGAPREA